MENTNWYKATQGQALKDLTEELKICKIYSKETPKQILCEDFPTRKWPISGGWGYSMSDAVVVELDNEADGVSFEYTFVEFRTYEELIIWRSKKDALCNIRLNLIMQTQLDGKDGKHYDILKMKVGAFTHPDYQFLKNDYDLHNGYADDAEGYAAHYKMYEAKRIYFEVECWFDITRFFGKS